MDGTPPPPPVDPPAYEYAATDIRPRQTREIELCDRAATFDWKYTGTAALGVISGEIVNTKVLKQLETPGIRLIGPAWIGLFWGGFLSGGFLSLPQCDTTWAYGAPPEGAIRSRWPIAIAISMLSMITAPVMDYAFLGAVKQDWTITERSARIFVGMGSGLVGSIVPYVLSPMPYAAAREIERIRVGPVPTGTGPFVSYQLAF